MGWRRTTAKRLTSEKRPDAPPSIVHNIIENTAVRVHDGRSDVYVSDGCAHNVFRDVHRFDTPDPVAIQRDVAEE